MPEPPVLILMGPPGSGKSTQALAVAERCGWESLDTGDLIRRAREDAGPLGQWVREHYTTGRLTPPPLVVELVAQTLPPLLTGSRGIVIHGSPRTLREAEALLKLFGTAVRKSRNLLIVLETPKPVTATRITTRWICTNCGYAVSAADPGAACVRCGGRYERRSDDTAEILEKRWEEYAFRTEPCLGFLARRMPVIRLDGDRPIPEITADVFRELTRAGLATAL